MEITKQLQGETATIKIRGRLDAYWSEHLSTELNATIRAGAHQIVLDLSEVQYISSAGIRVFLNFYRQLNAIDGSFSVSELSSPASSILEMAGLKDLLVQKKPAVSQDVLECRVRETDFARFTIFSLNPAASLQCKAFGNPGLLNGCRYQETDAQQVDFPGSSFGLGLGAFGETFAECRSRFGEYLAVGGSAMYQPTDGTNTPDYMLASGALIPRVLALYGILCSGDFSHLIRFDSKSETAIAFSPLLLESLSIVEAENVGIVMVAETAGLLGASMMQSPVIQASQDVPFTFPMTPQWFSFSAERSFIHSLCMAAGVASRRQDFIPAWTRPLRTDQDLYGHFHAAAFPYRPLPKGNLPLAKVVSTVFESEAVLGVTHLLNDDRQIGGAGESDFVRGAIWVGPIGKVEA